MGQNETLNAPGHTVQEFNFIRLEENELAAIADDLSQEEAAAALAAIRSIREERDSKKGQNFKDWFDQAFLPILKDFAEMTGSKLKIEQDSHFDITATFNNRCGVDITPSQKMMHMVVSAADHISINKWEGAEDVEFSLIFGFPDDAE